MKKIWLCCNKSSNLKSNLAHSLEEENSDLTIGYHELLNPEEFTNGCLEYYMTLDCDKIFVILVGSNITDKIFVREMKIIKRMIEANESTANKVYKFCDSRQFPTIKKATPTIVYPYGLGEDDLVEVITQLVSMGIQEL